MKAFIGAINRRKPAEMAALRTVDHTFIDSAGKVETGCKKLTAGWEVYCRMLPDCQIKVQKVLRDKEVVAVLGAATGTYNGKPGLVPANRITMPGLGGR